MVTYKPLNKVIINYFSKNNEDLQQKVSRALNLEFVGKIAEIYVICSTEDVEKQWLKKALSSYPEEKINYI